MAAFETRCSANHSKTSGNFTTFFRTALLQNYLWAIAFGETEAATGGVLSKRVFLENSQNLQKNTCSRVRPQLQDLGLQLYLKKLMYKCFSVNFCEIFKNTYYEEHQRTAASGET